MRSIYFTFHSNIVDECRRMSINSRETRSTPHFMFMYIHNSAFLSTFPRAYCFPQCSDANILFTIVNIIFLVRKLKIQIHDVATMHFVISSSMSKYLI